jgi:glycogen debranching enzyme
VTGATYSTKHTARRRLQPLLHDAVLCVVAPTMAVSGTDGQMRSGLHGLYEGDRRVLSRLLLTVDGEEPELLRGQLVGTSGARFAAVVRTVGEELPDPALIIDRRRDLRAEQGASTFERVRLHNAGRVPVEFDVVLEVACDFIDIIDVKSGHDAEPVPPQPSADGLTWSLAANRAALLASPPPDRIEAPAGRLHWTVALQPGQTWLMELSAKASIGEGSPMRAAPAGDPIWVRPEVDCDDTRLAQLVGRSLDDLAGLRLADPEQPDDQFLAAGAPWFLTLFGRDAIWAARMLLPLGTVLAAGTLRALARRQGVTHDPVTTEQPGKILHELRAEVASGAAVRLPPRYYGTVDATPLFITLLAEAWRWGLAEAEVAALLPHAQRALAWLRDSGDPDGDGFIEYVPSGSGLANQGWKDSHDGVQSAGGVLADPPIALCEAQAYAYQAARNGADLLDAFNLPGGTAWREWAADLRSRFNRRYWVEDADGPYLAIALDAAKRPVDGLASNMGHVLGTGILDAEGAAAVARRLGSPDMDSGYGLRTFGARSARYNPLGYHVGSIWPHDTAIAVDGLARSGHRDVAIRLARGLIDAAQWFDYRLPELFSGEQRIQGVAPLPYPAACRPQAWSAASAILILTSLLGLEPNAPSGRLVVAKPHPMPYRRLTAENLRIAQARLDIRLLDGTLEVAAPPTLQVEIR